LVGVQLFTHGLFATKFGDNSLIAKEKARAKRWRASSLLEILSKVTFSQIKNVSNGGIF
jgi:hypothetical protein